MKCRVKESEWPVCRGAQWNREREHEKGWVMDVANDESDYY